MLTRWIQRLTWTHRWRYTKRIWRSLTGVSLAKGSGFAASLDRACREFVNRNAATGTSSTKSPELIAKHTNMLIHKNDKMAKEDDLEGALFRIPSIQLTKPVSDVC